MARKKAYKEDEVIEKAMNLFWKNGFETTSMQMLEKEMGINKFSIYSSFGSKNGILIESLKSYKSKIKIITSKLKESQNGIIGIKQYFYDFLEFSMESNLRKGCLVTNISNESGEHTDPKIKAELTQFTDYIKQLFIHNLKQDRTKSEETIEEQADYLIISMFGLSSASRSFSKQQIIHYIENTFNHL